MFLTEKISFEVYACQDEVFFIFTIDFWFFLVYSLAQYKAKTERKISSPGMFGVKLGVDSRRSQGLDTGK